jgi:hypothetical protein
MGRMRPWGPTLTRPAESRLIGVNPMPCLTTPEPSDARRSNRTLGGKSVFFPLRVYPHHHLGESSRPTQTSRAQGFPPSILNPL